MLQSCCLYKLLISNAWREESVTRMKDYCASLLIWGQVHVKKGYMSGAGKE